MDDEFEPIEQAMAAVAKMRIREEVEQQVFSLKVDQEEAADCKCQCCPPRSTQEAADYCCNALFTLDLLKKGKLLRDGLMRKLKEPGHHSCIVKDKLFTTYIMNEAVSIYFL